MILWPHRARDPNSISIKVQKHFTNLSSLPLPLYILLSLLCCLARQVQLAGCRLQVAGCRLPVAFSCCSRRQRLANLKGIAASETMTAASPKLATCSVQRAACSGLPFDMAVVLPPPLQVQHAACSMQRLRSEASNIKQLRLHLLQGVDASTSRASSG